MLVIRKINQKEQDSIFEFCKRIGRQESLDYSQEYFGVFNSDQLQGYIKIDFQSLTIPLLNDLQVIDSLDSPCIEGLIRGAFHYCYTKGYDKVALQDLKILKKHSEDALSMLETERYNNTLYHILDLETFFNKPCKGRSM